jgi:hypothetical protein
MHNTIAEEKLTGTAEIDVRIFSVHCLIYRIVTIQAAPQPSHSELSIWSRMVWFYITCPFRFWKMRSFREMRIWKRLKADWNHPNLLASLPRFRDQISITLCPSVKSIKLAHCRTRLCAPLHRIWDLDPWELKPPPFLNLSYVLITALLRFKADHHVDRIDKYSSEQISFLLVASSCLCRSFPVKPANTEFGWSTLRNVALSPQQNWFLFQNFFWISFRSLPSSVTLGPIFYLF